MKLSKEQVKKIVLLARLGLEEKEISKYQEQLSDILEYVNKLQKVDTSGVSPEAHAEDLKSIWREDEARGCGEEERKLVLENMPDKEGDLLKTIGVFKK